MIGSFKLGLKATQGNDNKEAALFADISVCSAKLSVVH